MEPSRRTGPTGPGGAPLTAAGSTGAPIAPRTGHQSSSRPAMLHTAGGAAAAAASRSLPSAPTPSAPPSPSEYMRQFGLTGPSGAPLTPAGTTGAPIAPRNAQGPNRPAQIVPSASSAAASRSLPPAPTMQPATHLFAPPSASSSSSSSSSSSGSGMVFAMPSTALSSAPYNPMFHSAGDGAGVGGGGPGVSSLFAPPYLPDTDIHPRGYREHHHHNSGAGRFVLLNSAAEQDDYDEDLRPATRRPAPFALPPAARSSYLTAPAAAAAVAIAPLRDAGDSVNSPLPSPRSVSLARRSTVNCDCSCFSGARLAMITGLFIALVGTPPAVLLGSLLFIAGFVYEITSCILTPEATEGSPGRRRGLSQ